MDEIVYISETNADNTNSVADSSEQQTSSMKEIQAVTKTLSQMGEGLARKANNFTLK